MLRALRLMLILSSMTAALPNGKAQVHTESGTTIILLISNEKAILAADSRVMRNSKFYNDEACKMIALGSQHVFAAAGTIQVTENGAASVYRAVDEAYRAGNDLAAAPEVLPIRDASSRWGAAIAVRLSKAVSDGRISPKQFVQGQLIVEGIFVGVNGEGKITYSVSPVVYSPPREGMTGNLFKTHSEWTVPEPGRVHTRSFGIRHIAAEFAAAKTSRSKAEREEWLKQGKSLFSPDFAIRLVDLTIAYDTSQGVGGFIDAVEITPESGVQWKQLKPDCKSLP